MSIAHEREGRFDWTRWSQRHGGIAGIVFRGGAVVRQVGLPVCRWVGCRNETTARNAKYCAKHAAASKRRANRAAYRKGRDSGKVPAASTDFITPGEVGGLV